ncbi:HAMP domain-containing sensor histidine kinase [Aminipila luticellarii]|uniref:histidine kinase n=1 Tax=Aminipila luticellarii TaxID=2507160 RepID=A0A410PSA8_9FIRM|nr:ATP-binding protein [Aminipila luticellarii]QAT41775.1 cell wall metabolism sensor histidine kinase WalK [Aminipila luticellarii]
MNIKKFSHSMRWKLVLIYCLLVFIATTIIGVLIMSRLEAYYIDSTKKNLTDTLQGGTLISSLKTYDKLSDHQEEIQSNIEAWSKTIQEEIFVIDDNFMIIASNNANQGKSAVGMLDTPLIMTTLAKGEASQSYGSIISKNTTIPVMNMAFPIGEGKNNSGVIYLRVDMTSIYNTINQSKQIFIQAMIVGLVITVILGTLIARSITTPINDVTEKAEKMAQGDFSQEVSVKSKDEIGRLADMFNLLRTQLDATLFEMSSEKNKMETILKHMADGLIAVNLDGQIIHANPAAAQILKVTPEDIQNESYNTLIKPLNEELGLEQLMAKCKSGELSDVFEKSGSTYSTRYDWFKDEDGNDVGIIILIEDITQRQKLENMQMDFVANVSHELKTPLTTIKSYTETLLDGGVDDPEIRSEFLEIIDNEADRMNRLVKDLLQLSRLDNNQEILNRKEGNLISLLKAAVKKIELTAKNKDQHLNCLFNPEERIPVDMDKDRIEQVILNVISNAIKYTPEGGRIDIDALKRDKTAVITVTDNGIGIPESEKSRIFERFFRVDKARSRAMGGTGLGLAISKQIVEGHQGTIQLESREGRGTKVMITLPLSLKKGIRNIE